MKIIVSFTSYPKRIETVFQVIKSLRKQTIQADRIILWLSMEEFPNKEIDLPKDLISANTDGQFEICWVTGNLKSHKKYYYALQEFRDDVVITVDDDTYYEPTMIEVLMESYKVHPNAISARNVHRIYAYKNMIAPYCTWNYSSDENGNIESLNLCAIGVGGILYPPKCSNPDWFDKEQIVLLAENQDDLWLKFQQIRMGIPVVFVNSRYEDYTIKDSQKTSLMELNLKRDNDICIQKLFRHYNHETSIKKWIQDLQQVTAVLLNKREKCIQKLMLYQGKRICIFGAGRYAKYLFYFIKKYVSGLAVECFLVSNKEENVKVIDEIPVIQVDSLNKTEMRIILLGVNEKIRREIRPVIHKLNDNIWVVVDMPAIKQVYQGLEAIGGDEVDGISHSSGV